MNYLGECECDCGSPFYSGGNGSLQSAYDEGPDIILTPTLGPVTMDTAVPMSLLELNQSSGAANTRITSDEGIDTNHLQIHDNPPELDLHSTTSATNGAMFFTYDAQIGAPERLISSYDTPAPTLNIENTSTNGVVKHLAENTSFVISENNMTLRTPGANTLIMQSDQGTDNYSAIEFQNDVNNVEAKMWNNGDTFEFRSYNNAAGVRAGSYNAQIHDSGYFFSSGGLTDLGTSGNPWKNFYAATSNLTDTTPTITLKDDTTGSLKNTGKISFTDSSDVEIGFIKLVGNEDPTFGTDEALFTSLKAESNRVELGPDSLPAFRPNATNTIDIGDSTYKFKDIYASGNIIAPRSAGWIYMENNSTTTDVTSTSTIVKAAGTTTLSNVNDFDDDSSTSNRLRYTGTLTKTFKVDCTLSQIEDEDSARDLIYIVLCKNGTAITGTIVHSTCDNDGDTPLTMGTGCLVSLATNDYVELWLRNTGAVRDVTIIDLQIVANEI